MAGPNDFTNQNIQDTYQRVLQISSSNIVTDGTGSVVPILQATASNAVSASYAVSASHEIILEVSSSYAESASFALTASYVDSSTLDTFKQTGHRNGDSVITGSLFVSASNGNITASGNISASGNLEISSSITFGDGIAKIIGPGNNDYILLSTDNIDFYLNGAEAVSFDPNQIIMNASNHNIDFKVMHDNAVAAIQTDASTNRVKIRDFVTIGSGSAPNADPNTLLVSGSSQFVGDITASGNISASGNIISDKVHANVIAGKVDGSGIVLGSASDIHVTASGNISASGTITANSFLVPFGSSILGEDSSGNINDIIVTNGADSLGVSFGDSDHSTILAGGAITLDSVLDIHLNADGGDVNFADGAGGTTVNINTTAGDISASGVISGSNIVKSMSTGTGNNVTLTLYDGTTFTRTINNVTNATNATNADCSDKVKTITCDANAERFITFVDDDNDPAACETVKTNPALRWNCAKRILIVDGAIKSKGSDVTIMSGSISMSGDLVITGSISSSTPGTSLIFTTGSFNHIITDGDTIEFRNASTKAVEGNLVFDPTNGLTVKTADKTAESNIKIANITAGETLIVGGRSDFEGEISTSAGIYVESQSAAGAGKGYVQAVNYRSISDTNKGVVFGTSKEKNYYRANGSHEFIDAPVNIDGNVSASGNLNAAIVRAGDPLRGIYTSMQQNVIAVPGHVNTIKLQGGVDVGTEIGKEPTIASDNGVAIIINALEAGHSGSFSIYNATNSTTIPGVNSSEIFAIDEDGNITASGDISASGTGTFETIQMDDNRKISFGNSQDLSIFHDGANSYIHDTGTGRLNIKGGAGVNIISPADENMATFEGNGEVNLYYNNVKKFETTNTGIQVAGDIIATDSTNISGSSTTTGSLARVESISNKTGNITTDSSQIVSADSLAIKAATDIRLSANGEDIFFSDGSSDKLTISTGTVPTITVDGNHTLDISGDYKIDVDGDDIQFLGSSTLRAQLHLDTIPELEFIGKQANIRVDDGAGTGALVIGASAGAYQYGTDKNYPNALLGGGQGDSTYVGFSGNELTPVDMTDVQFISGSLKNVSGGTIQVTHSWPIPPGAKVNGCALVADSGTSYRLEMPSLAPFCGAMDSVKTGITSVTCPARAGYKRLGLTLLSKTEANKLVNSDGLGNRVLMTADVPNNVTVNGLAYSYELL